MAAEHGAFETDGIGTTAWACRRADRARTTGWSTSVRSTRSRTSRASTPAVAHGRTCSPHPRSGRAGRLRAFNLRLAQHSLLARARRSCTTSAGAWLDDCGVRGCALTEPLATFAHQRDFYRSLAPDRYAGHPLVSTIAARRPARRRRRTAAASRLPGSRRARSRATHRGARRIRAARAAASDQRVRGRRRDRRRRPRRSLPAALAAAGDDRAFGARRRERRRRRGRIRHRGAQARAARVPALTFYVLPSAVPYVRVSQRLHRAAEPRVERAVIPELIQDAATPEALADALEQLLCAPQEQLAALPRARAALGPPDALQRCARFALSLVR